MLDETQNVAPLLDRHRRPWLACAAALCLAPSHVSAGPAAPAAAVPELFRFKLSVGDVLIVEKYQEVRIRYPDGRNDDREEKNRIVLKAVAREVGSTILEGTFVTYTRTPPKNGAYRFNRTYLSRFKLYDDGRYDVPPEYVMPNLRDLPTFADAALSPQSRWRKPALETLHVGQTRINMPVQVDYLYSGIQALPAEAGPKVMARGPLPRFQYAYTINTAVANRKSPIRHITGFSADMLWFDNEEGVPRFDSNRLAYTFTMFDGSKVDYRFRILSWYRKERTTKAPDKAKMEEEVRKGLEKKSEVSVKKDDQGIRLTLNSVLFDFDSAHLRPAARRGLESIADVLKEHSDREIRISGHTDNRGRPSYNRALSSKRALAVLDTLREMGVNPRQMSYKGYGETLPVADNRSAHGRAQNRRVEILIVTD